MKTNIHPQYYSDAKAKCACGAKFVVGSTQKEIEVEICSACHPFYTGQEKIVDTAGRVEKFKQRKAAAKEGISKKEKKVAKAEKKASKAKKTVVKHKSTSGQSKKTSSKK